jgi:hypothetical protein
MRPNFFNQNAGRTFPFTEDFQEHLEQSEASLSAGGGSSLNTGLAHFWSFNNTVDDAVGNIDLVDVGTPAYIAGKLDEALDIVTGTGVRATGAVPDLDGDKTYAVWFKLPTLATTDGAVFHFYTGPTHQAKLRLSYNTGIGSVTVEFHRGANNSTLVTLAAPYDTDWHLMVITVNSSNDLCTLYLDADQDSVFDIAVLSQGSAGTSTWTAAGYDWVARRDGPVHVDALGVWDRMLTEEERLYLWNSGAGVEYPNFPVTESMIWGMQNLPNDAIVDFGCTFGVDIGYDASLDKVYLHTIRRTATSLIFDFRTTVRGLDEAQYVLRFTRSLTEDDYVTEYVNIPVSEEIEASVSQCGSSSLNDWGGYLVTGNLESLKELLQDGDVIRGDVDGAVVEPGLVRSQRKTFLRRVYLANGERTRTTNPPGCEQQTWPFTRQGIYPARHCLIGNVRFIEGYNVTIEQLPSENKLTINATVGGGQGEPPVEVPVFADEEPADGRNLLTGGPKCNEVIRSINGVGGRVVDLFAGAGCTIEADPDNHQLIVDFGMNNMALCYDGDDFEVSLYEEPTPRSPYCGEAT